MDLPVPDAFVLDDYRRLQQRLDGLIGKLRADQTIPSEPVQRLAIVSGILDELEQAHPTAPRLLAAAAINRLVYEASSGVDLRKDVDS